MDQADNSAVTEDTDDSGGSHHNDNMVHHQNIIINQVRIVPVESMFLPVKYGPCPPPSLLIDQLLNSMLPKHCMDYIPVSIPNLIFSTLLAKRDWSCAFEGSMNFTVSWKQPEATGSLVGKCMTVARMLNYDEPLIL